MQRVFLRNKSGLTPDQIEKAQLAWKFLTSSNNSTLSSSTISSSSINFDISYAHLNNTKTVFNESTKTVKLGADAYPGQGDANSRMSLLACLCHELSHAQRYQMGFVRPLTEPECNLDEAETSLHASYIPVLSLQERKDLVEDAQERIRIWERKI